MNSPERDELHKWVTNFAETVLGDLSRDEQHSKSFVFLDAPTINLLLVYMTMNKELEISRKGMHASEPLPEIEAQIDELIAENKQRFEALLSEVKKKG